MKQYVVKDPQTNKTYSIYVREHKIEKEFNITDFKSYMDVFKFVWSLKDKYDSLELLNLIDKLVADVTTFMKEKYDK